MNFGDIVHNVKATAGYAGATINTDTDTTSTIVIDTNGYESIAFLVYMGAITAGNATPKIMETDNSDGTTSAAEVSVYQATAKFTKSPDLSNTVLKVGAKLTKRYCTLRLTTDTSANLIVKGAIAILGGAHMPPVA